MRSKDSLNPQTLYDVLADGVAWKGTDEEAAALWQNIERACDESDTPCPRDLWRDGCPVLGILDDQDELDRLLITRRSARRLIAEEGIS